MSAGMPAGSLVTNAPLARQRRTAARYCPRPAEGSTRDTKWPAGSSMGRGPSWRTIRAAWLSMSSCMHRCSPTACIPRLRAPRARSRTRLSTTRVGRSRFEPSHATWHRHATPRVSAAQTRTIPAPACAPAPAPAPACAPAPAPAPACAPAPAPALTLPSGSSPLPSASSAPFRASIGGAGFRSRVHGSLWPSRPRPLAQDPRPSLA